MQNLAIPASLDKIVAVLGDVQVYIARRHPDEAPVPESTEKSEPVKELSTGKALLLVVTGIGGLILGARLLVDSAVYFAALLGVSQAVIALTIVAIGTSLPELATSLVAAIRGERDIAIGNVVGSNIFNILSILGLAPLIRPIYAADVGWTDLGVMLFFTFVLIPIMWTGKRISRGEGAFLFFGYILYTLWLIFR